MEFHQRKKNSISYLIIHLLCRIKLQNISNGENYFRFKSDGRIVPKLLQCLDSVGY